MWPPDAFRWNEWNVEHLEKHRVEPEEAEQVVRAARPPYPSYRGDGKFLVWGPGTGGRMLQVVFVVDEDGTAYVIHARSMTGIERRRLRRGRRRRGPR